MTPNVRPPASSPDREIDRLPGPRVEVVQADLDDLSAHLGAQVRVGGLVLEREGHRVLLDDGSATGEILLTGEAAALAPLLEAGDAVAVTGRVVRAGGTGVVEVDAPGAVVRLGDLGEPLGLVTTSPSSAGAPAADATPVATFVGKPTEAGGVRSASTGEAGRSPLGAPIALGLALALVLAACVTPLFVRRSLGRRRHAARIAARLAGIGPTVRPAAVGDVADRLTGIEPTIELPGAGSIATLPGRRAVGYPASSAAEQPPSVREPA